ncbi:Biopolymer transport protein ExbD/TolR [Isosphaera pallida ATCC 43644]|uniref:Biopolymer transport protein ExbD/TolR n=1 Tax=Isosphaera pallida (strain ATCC 43644 / DSM 9630 / IS1B) TaxID=575540 RepID=E8R3X8_ISOPI|nr:biopolymer transporter ExbD [Isosphaera pallida]ADV63708.1 Biopolymer transport protein ExbD/TolR [Isosphaera pallida ATCC 43644]
MSPPASSTPSPSVPPTDESLWDVFLIRRKEIRTNVPAKAIHLALGLGKLTGADGVRPAGSPPDAIFTRLADHPRFQGSIKPSNPNTAAPQAVSSPTPPTPPTSRPAEAIAQAGAAVAQAGAAVAATAANANPAPSRQTPAASITADRTKADSNIIPEPEEEEWGDEDAADTDLSLARPRPTTVEELDLAAMVDVALQLVLFFLVTASTIVFKAMAIPTPTPEPPEDAVAQEIVALTDIENSFIMVEIDTEGRLRVNQEPVEASFDALVAALRAARDDTGMTSMLLSADAATRHKNAVLALDAAQAIGLGISLARPILSDED